jgi:hypothetical protein
LTIREEIEQVIRAGATPLFLTGLIKLVQRGEGERLLSEIDLAGTKIYKERLEANAVKEAAV